MDTYYVHYLHLNCQKLVCNADEPLVKMRSEMFSLVNVTLYYRVKHMIKVNLVLCTKLTTIWKITQFVVSIYR